MMHKNNGFTLVELMIVIALIGVVAALGYPAYKDASYRARRADAKSGLAGLQLAQEKYRANCIRYAGAVNATATNYSCTTSNYTLTYPVTSPDGHYGLNIIAATTTTYTLRAAVVSGGKQAKDAKCQAFFIDQDNVKTSSTSASANSSTTDTNNCW